MFHFSLSRRAPPCLQSFFAEVGKSKKQNHSFKAAVEFQEHDSDVYEDMDMTVKRPISDSKEDIIHTSAEEENEKYDSDLHDGNEASNQEKHTCDD